MRANVPAVFEDPFGDDDADGVLVKAFETAFELEILQIVADGTFATKCFCR
jgi:hypothetical protein